VQIAAENHSLTMRISDDGSGFDLAGKNGTGNGLRNMQSRSKEIGAELAVSSAPAGGTTVQLKMGLNR
jgi:signal transduction histidine kinase